LIYWAGGTDGGEWLPARDRSKPLTEVGKFAKFLPFHRPVTEDPAFSVGSTTNIAIKDCQKVVC
jgi:hypothetical protein